MDSINLVTCLYGIFMYVMLIRYIMPHEDFFEATLIEFTVWKNDHEMIIAKYNSFEELPSHLKDELQKHSSKMYFRGSEWTILEINRDLRAHGKGVHVKVRLEKI